MISTNHDEFYRILGSNIRTLRTQKKISQSTFAAAINLSRTSVVNIEQGRQHPSVYLLARISYILCISIVDLIPKFIQAGTVTENVDLSVRKAIEKTGVSENSQQALQSFIINPTHES
jgi:transcriptional regulator with XRE-family HTH domain